MQNVWFKSRTCDVCGRFVVAVSFAEGNVRANGACDRVVCVVQCRGNSVAGARYACLAISECKMFGSSRATVTFVDVLWSLFHLSVRGRVELSSFGCNESDDDSNTTAFDGARYTKVETTQRCCCLDECRSMTEYGPELKLFVLKSNMSWHCFEIKHVMTSRSVANVCRHSEV